MFCTDAMTREGGEVVEPKLKKARANSGISTRPGRRERNKQEKRARIVGAARELFGTKGFAETTTQEIAEKADIGTGTLFLYAKSKEDLLVMVFKDEMLETFLAAFKKVPAGAPFADQLMHVFGMMIAYHAKDVELSRALLKEITVLRTPERRQDLRTLMRAIYGGIADLVAAHQKTGNFRAGANPLLAAENLFAVYYLSLLGWLGGQIPKQKFIRELRAKLDITIEGLAAPGTPKPAASKQKTSRKS
jgi:AcrR family transcriptional regulator